MPAIRIRPVAVRQVEDRAGRKKSGVVMLLQGIVAWRAKQRDAATAVGEGADRNKPRGLNDALEYRNPATLVDW